MILLICIFAGLRVLENLLGGSFRVSQPLLLLPLAGIWCIALFQTAMLTGWVKTWSLDPYETRIFITVFGGIVVTGEVLYFYTNTADRLKMLIGLVIAVGMGSTIFGIFRESYLGAQSELLSEYFMSSRGYAQFINQNHFVLLVEMTLGLIMGLLIKAGVPNTFKPIAWVCCGIMIYSAVRANSRGGLISIAGMCIFTVFVHIVTRHNPEKIPKPRRSGASATNRHVLQKILAAAGISTVIFALILVAITFVGGERTVTRFEKLNGEVVVPHESLNRAAIWSSTIELIKTRPILGVGFGAYAAAIPEFDASGGRLSLQQAHNEYLEVLANGGVVSFVLFACFGVLVVLKSKRKLKSPDVLRRSSCFGAMIGMFGVMIHSFVDFGLHISINALIFTVLVVIATADIRIPNPIGPTGKFV
jgi:O-antigen ligase